MNTSNHYTSQPLTAERVAALDRAKMLAFYRDRFANAADFTFFMVGAFRLDAAIPLLAQYVGSLPSTGEADGAVQGLGVRFPSGIERVRVEKGREPRSQTVISFFADPPPDAGEQERITAATDRALHGLARRAARGARADIHGVGGPVAVAGPSAAAAMSA